MKQLNKEICYRGYKFNIKIELNTKEIKDDMYHTVTTNSIGFDNYYQKEVVNDNLIVLYITDIEQQIIKYVDIKIDGTVSIEERLSKLGFW